MSLKTTYSYKKTVMIVISYKDSSPSGYESSEDIVLNDTLASMSESETEKTSDESEIEENVEDMATTRVGELPPTGEFRNIDKPKTVNSI